MGLYAFQIGLLLLRGPHCERFTWFGYEGGLEYRKKVVDERKAEIERQERVESEADVEKIVVKDSKKKKKAQNIRNDRKY